MGLREYIHNHPEWIFYILGICLIGFGLVYALWIWIWFSLGGASILISLGTALIAWGIHMRTGTIITDITDISTKAEGTTRKIATSSLHETIGIMEDRRLLLREKMIKITHKTNTISDYIKKAEWKLDRQDLNIYLSFSVWKFKRYLDRTMIFEENLSENDKEELIHQVDCIFQDLCEGKLQSGIKFASNYIGNLESMYNTISNFERFNRDNVKDKHRRDRILNNLEFLKDLTNKVILFDRTIIVKIR